METNYKGIDYGLGLSNIDNETGIRYGVINQNEVDQSWFDSSEAVYPENYFCPNCGNELIEIATEERDGTEYHCEHCNAEYTDNDICDFEIDPIGFVYNADGYICEQFADDTDIFITKSPYYTYCQFCSPCAPGAGYLMNYYDPMKDEKKVREQFVLLKNIAPLAIPEAYKSYAEKAGFPKVYCFGHDWFENGKAPYPVYSVETGELIEA